MYKAHLAKNTEESKQGRPSYGLFDLPKLVPALPKNNTTNTKPVPAPVIRSKL